METKITRTEAPKADAMVDSQEVSAQVAQIVSKPGPDPILTIDPNVPHALRPAFEAAWDLFFAMRIAVPARVSPDTFRNFSPIVEWNPRQEQAIALVARIEDDQTDGVFVSKKLGRRPALSIGPEWLTLSNPLDIFSSVVMAYADWVNLYGGTNSAQRFTVDVNGFVRNRSSLKHSEWFEKTIGVQALTGTKGRYMTALMSCRPLAGKYERDDGAPFYAKEFFVHCDHFGPISAKVNGLERFVPESGAKSPTKNPRRAWVCHCRTSDSKDPKDLKRYAPAGQWIMDYCHRCKRFVRPLTSAGTDTCVLFKDTDGQAVLARVAAGESDEKQALSHLLDYDKRAADATSPEVKKALSENKHAIETVLAKAHNQAAFQAALKMLEEALEEPAQSAIS